MQLKLKTTYFTGLLDKATKVVTQVEHKFGEVIEVAEEEGKRLLGLGHAEAVESKAAPAADEEAAPAGKKGK